MSIPVFPEISRPITPEEALENVGISTQMEDGTVVSRARFTRSRITFTLKWGCENLLSTADKEALRLFYQETVKGSSEMFKWTCNAPYSPHFGKEFIVRFTGEPPKFKLFVKGYWMAEVAIMEV